MTEALKSFIERLKEKEKQAEERSRRQGTSFDMQYDKMAEVLSKLGEKGLTAEQVRALNPDDLQTKKLAEELGYFDIKSGTTESGQLESFVRLIEMALHSGRAQEKTTTQPDEKTDKWKCLRCGDEQEFERGKRPLVCPNPICGKRVFGALTGPYQFFDGNRFVPKLLADKIMDGQHFATHRESWSIYRYSKGCYLLDGEATIREFARAELEKLAKDGYVNEGVNHIRDVTFRHPSEFNPPLDLISVKNGILNVKTVELSEHKPNPIFIQQLPVEWNPNASCPNVKKFLSEILSPEDSSVIQEIVGYCLLRNYPLAKAVMFLGEGNNGKSTLLRLISSLLGEDNIATPSLHDLLSDRFAKAELYGKLANIHADIPAKKLGATGAFKMLTGQDLIYAQEKHKKPFTFRNYAKLLYSTNELPATDDTSEAFWRRWILLKFPNQFPEGDPKTDPNILDKLTTPEELSGFLNWALEGLSRLLENKRFTMTTTRKEIETEWVASTDSLRAFRMKYVSADSGYFVVKDDFYKSYLNFCSNFDIPAVEMSLVGRRLPVLVSKIDPKYKPLVDGRQHPSWKGLRLREPYQENNRMVIKDIQTTRQQSKKQDYCTQDTANTLDIPDIKKKTRTKGTKGESPPLEDLGEATTLPRDIQGLPSALDILTAIDDGAPWHIYKIPKKADVPKRICLDTIAELGRKGYVVLSEGEDKPIVKITEKGRGVVNG